jgi:hypothetical protein
VTTPTTLTPGTRQLPEPCWTIGLIDGTALVAGEAAPGCWTSKEKAEAAIDGWADEDRPAAFMQAEPRDYRCWELTLVCGTGFVYEGEVDQVHFDDRADLLDAMTAQKVVQVDGVGQYADPECCNQCRTALGLPAEPDAEVHLDQVPLFATTDEVVHQEWLL